MKERFKDTDLREALRRREERRLKPQPSADFCDSVMRQIEVRPASRRRWHWVAAAACLLIIIGIGAAHQPVVVALFGYRLVDIARHEVHLWLVLLDIVGNVARQHDALEGFLIVVEVVEVDEPCTVAGFHTELFVLIAKAATVSAHGKAESLQGIFGLVLFHEPSRPQVHKALDVHAAHLLIALAMADDRPKGSNQRDDDDVFSHDSATEAKALLL